MTCSKEFADKLVEHNGWIDNEDHDAPDNPQATRIVEYTNQGGVLAYGVTFPNDDPDKYLRESPYIQAPRIYWEARP